MDSPPPTPSPPKLHTRARAVGFVYLVPRFLAAKFQVLFLHERDHEGRGMLWPVLRGRVVASLVIYQLTMAVTLALKVAPAQAVLAAAVRGRGRNIALRARRGGCTRTLYSLTRVLMRAPGTDRDLPHSLSRSWRR